MTRLAVPRELNATRSQKNIRTLPIERLTRCVAMQRLLPRGMSILMTFLTTRRREELIDGNELTIDRARVGRRKTFRSRRNCIGFFDGNLFCTNVTIPSNKTNGHAQ